MEKRLEEKTIWELGQSLEMLVLDGDEVALRKHIDTALKYNIRTFICAPYLLKEAKEYINGKNLKLGSGGSFPTGSDSSQMKVQIAKEVIEMGATDIEIPVNMAALLAGKYDLIDEELRLVREATKGHEYKAIIEVSQVKDDEMLRKVAELVVKNNVDVFKTGTGTVDGPSMEQVGIVADVVEGTNTLFKVSGVKAPKAQNTYMFLKAGSSYIGSRGVVEILEGIHYLRQRGIIEGPKNDPFVPSHK